MTGGALSSASDDDGGGFTARCASSSKPSPTEALTRRLLERSFAVSTHRVRRRIDIVEPLRLRADLRRAR